MPPKFQQRHYIAIAEEIKDAKTSFDPVEPAYEGQRLIRNLIRMFERDNPKFDRDRFERAIE